MKKTKVYLNDIMNRHPDKDYAEIYNYVMDLIDKGDIVPIKRADSNGRKPALPLAFWQYEVEKEYSDVFEELKYRIHPMLDTAYYRAHPEKYAEDRHNIKLLSDYLKDNSNLLDIQETMNERSFEIFRREKFFQEESGLRFCNRLGISSEQLKFYETSEPLSYYSYSKKVSQNILIIENKDTFYDIRRYMQAVSNKILGIEFGTVIYGAGKGIWKTFSDYADGAETYFCGNNKLLYFGDIDYEGILIYEHLVKKRWMNNRGTEIKVKPFIAAYKAALDKAESIGIDGLPDTKEKQNNNIDTIFLDYFDEVRKEQILRILKAGKYIPQEILNEHDWG